MDGEKWLYRQRNYLEKLALRLLKSSKLTNDFSIELELHPHGESCHEIYIYTLGHRTAIITAYGPFKSKRPDKIVICGEDKHRFHLNAISFSPREYGAMVKALDNRIAGLIDAIGLIIEKDNS